MTNKEKDTSKIVVDLLEIAKNKEETLNRNRKKVLEELGRLETSISLHSELKIDMEIMMLSIVDHAPDIKEHKHLIENITLLDLELSKPIPLDEESKKIRVQIIRNIIRDIRRLYLIVLTKYFQIKEKLLYKTLKLQKKKKKLL